MKVLSITVGLALVLAVMPVEAKHKNKIKTVVGCVQGAPHHYLLSTVTKKGKKREYDLVGDRDFGPQVGHKVEAHGAVDHGGLKVSSVKTLASSCH